MLINSNAPPEWALRVAARRPLNVAVVALANKIARTLWALLAHGRVYQTRFCGLVGVAVDGPEQEDEQVAR